MRKLLFLVSFVAIVGSRVFGGLTDEQLGRFQQQLSNSDPKIRLAALEDLQKAHLETAANNVLPLLSKALRDPDQKVRAEAAAYLAMISFVTAPKFRTPAENATDLSSYPPLKKDLIATFNDADEETRKNALAAYVLAFEVTPAIQNELVSRYESERPNSLFRTVILGALMIDGAPTPAAKALLVRVAGTPNGSVALAQVINDSKVPPAELLPIFVNQFSTASDSVHRATFARAIKKFGALAKPYIPILARAADLEPDDVTRKNIKDAVAAIQAAK
jgi:HEAT repeat protein